MTLNLVNVVVVALLSAAAVLALVRMWIGPYTPDRIVATDTLAVIATAAIVVCAMLFDSPFYLDVALLYGVLAFVGVVALARVIEAKQS
ncbi:monovalent cation/H+ antiporter complex subunit F [Thiosocius teredinicola]|uniref:monovalent cation/H+ antiporter complex subunit F n=1 Tax=Thiosocius teredinicola TaxID=1973002 RepID=UPI000990A031